MWTHGNRIKILVGHNVSGKTELALNMARSIHDAGHRTALVDLDIVNPFFRSAEQGAWLESNGIRLLAPTFALTAVDIPALPAEILSVFNDRELRVVFDVGGDDAGAMALGRYNRQFLETGYELIYVVNIFRPRSGSVQEIMDMMQRVSECSRLKPTGLINNSNLGNLTDRKTVEEGHELLQAVARESGLPLLADAAALPGILPLSDGTPGFPIERITKPEWMEL